MNNLGAKKVVFEQVEKRGRRWLVIGALLAVAGVVVASAITVNEKSDTSTLYAERVGVGQAFTIGDSTFWPAKADAPALGTQGTPVEITAALPIARTSFLADRWVYTVPIVESSAGAATNGNYTVQLFVDEVSAGTLYVRQTAPDPSGAPEGVTASFTIGKNLSTSALYYVVVKPVVQVGPTVAYTVESTPNGNLTWTGTSGVTGVNPTLHVALGSTLRLTAKNADGAGHNIGIKSASATLVDPKSFEIPNSGDTQTVVWKPSAGTYTYFCSYHSTSGLKMYGTIVVG